jgi:hypothetical protein
VAEDLAMGPDRWLTITAPGNQDCVLALHETRNETERALVGKQMGSYPFLGIETDDCVADYERLKTLGIKFDGEPTVRPYGTGVMLKDLYGNKIFLNQESAEAAASA